MKKIFEVLKEVNNILLIPVICFTLLSLIQGIPIEVVWNSWELIFTLCFGAEWVLGFFLSEEKLSYLKSPAKILDLISCLPLGPLTQSFRLARFLRLLRIVRVWSRIDKLKKKFWSLLRAFFLVSILVLTGAFSLFVLEPQTVTSSEEAIWWSVVTLSTVGYGDITPHTPEGHALACVLILIGLGVIGYASGIASSFFQAEEQEELKELLETILQKMDQKP
jgi:voltage-gated potassium channel